MFTIALVLAAIAVATRLVTVVRHDRPRTAALTRARARAVLGRDHPRPLTRATPVRAIVVAGDIGVTAHDLSMSND